MTNHKKKDGLKRALANPKACARLVRLKWVDRIRAMERELGTAVYSC